MARNGHHAAPDGGFTLVELIVALTVVAIGVVGLIGVIQSSMGVVVKTNQRSRCVNVATQVIEAYRAVPYTQLTPASTTSTTQKTVNGSTCTASSALTWASDGTTATAYKQATVDVTWTDPAGAHDVRQTTLIYNGDSTATTTSTTVAGGGGGGSCPAPSPVTNLVATTPLNVSGTTGVDLAWVPPVASPVQIAAWRIQSSVDSFSSYYTVTNGLSAAVTGLRVNGLSSGTTYQFRIQGLSVCGTTSTWSPIATATTETAASILCVPGAATVTPTGTGRANNGANAALNQTPVVSINTSGTCATLTFKYSPRTGVQRTGSLVKGVGGVYSGVIPTATSEAWDVGQHAVDIYDSVPIKRATVVLTVCEKNAATCG